MREITKIFNVYRYEELSQAKELWVQFGEIPMNPVTEELEMEWHGFLIGTHREDIWHWFEETFNVSVAEDLMGLGNK